MTAKGEKWDYVMQKAPALQKLINDFGDVSLWEYAQNNYISHGPASVKRKNEFLSYLSKYVRENHGEKIQNTILESLLSNYCISTADHHGPIGHPFFFQSAILR